jgi:hypothetical protein
MLTECVGLARRLKHFDLIGQAGRDAVELARVPRIDFFLWLLLTGENSKDTTLGRYFSRVAIAQLPAEIASEIRGRLIGAIDYWQSRVAKLVEEGVENGVYAVERLRLFIEALARVAVRQEPSTAFDIFRLAMTLGENPLLRHWWLFEPIDNLIRFSVEAIPPSNRSALVLAALEFPLSSEAGLTGQFPQEWPNPLTSLYDTAPNRPSDDILWRKRVLELIQASAGEGRSRHEAILRLAYLAHHGALTHAESASFCKTLWSRKDAQEPPLPLDTGLLSFVFAKLPSPAGVNAKKSVLTRLFDVKIQQLLTPAPPTGKIEFRGPEALLQSIAAAGNASVRPTAKQAARLFDELVSWRSYTLTSPLSALPLVSGYLDQQNENLGWLIGQALAQTISLRLSPRDLTEVRARALLGLINQARVYSAIEALPYFAISDDHVVKQIVQTIRRAVASPRISEALFGVLAVERWAKLDEAREQRRLPNQLISQIMSAIETRRETLGPALLRCTQTLLELQRLTVSDLALVCQVLGELFLETVYDTIDPNSRAAASVSLVRGNCVRLARALQKSGSSENAVLEWLDAVEKDPLPEVRFA